MSGSQSSPITGLPAAIAGADDLPSPPSVALEVLRLTQDGDSTIDDLANVLSRDPALSAKLLKLSNSSLFNLGQEVTSLQRATMVLGLKTVKLMSLSFSLAGSLPRDSAGSRFDFDGYWRRSLVGAVAGRSLARLVGSRCGDEAFLCGLLSHIGQLVLSQCLPVEYDEVLAQADGHWPTLELEQRLLGFHSSDVAMALLHSWDLPELLYTSIGYMQRAGDAPDDVDETTRELIDLLMLTNLTIQVLCDEDKGRPMQRLHELAAERYSIGAGKIDGFLVGLECGIKETAEMLNVKIPEGCGHESMIEQARSQIVHISLGAAVEPQSTREADATDARARVDELTGLPNRAALDEFIDLQLTERMNGAVPRALGVVLFDLDNFDTFNATHGRPAGDEVLRMVGGVLARLTRSGDLAARYGGEEFAVVAAQATPFGLKTLAERVRTTLAAEVVEFEGQDLCVTASFGGACLAKVDSLRDGEALVQIAARYLAKAKESGRNRTEVCSKVQMPWR